MKHCLPLTFRACLFVTALLALPTLAVPPPKPTNVIVILADDLGWADVGFNGRREWRTPNLDKLAKQGTVFRRWYTAAVVCAPSRAALMTGKYTIHCGVSANNDDLPASETTLAEALHSRGYTTALFGKWHHGAPPKGMPNWTHPLDHGFDEFFGFTDARHAWEKFPKELWFGREKKPVSGYADDLFTDRAVEFIQKNKERPFFLYLSLVATHLHIEAPAEETARFKGKFPEKDANNPANAAYAGIVTRLDKEVGRVMKTLDDAGVSKNTLVIFTSDHGATFESGNRGASAFHDSNRPFRGQKRTLWEGGIRVPAVVRWPGRVPSGVLSDEIIHMTDVFPTVLAATGGAPVAEWKVDGRNLLGVWTGKEKPSERTLFWEWRTEGYNQIAAMRGDYKLVITGNTTPELFNVETDPAERRSLHAEHPALTKQLRDELTAWLATDLDPPKAK